MKLKSLITVFLALVIVAVLTAMVLPFFAKVKIGRPSNVQLDISELAYALRGYESEYGMLPGGENSNVVRILAGDNQKKIEFLNFRRSAEHSNEMVDPWETPYQIQFFQQTNFVLRSAGKDKIFGDADDIIFNSVSNDFVKP
jgi:hypothetical protein